MEYEQVKLNENPIYSSKRIGDNYRNQFVSAISYTSSGYNSDGTVIFTTSFIGLVHSGTSLAPPQLGPDYSRTIGNKSYELTDLLGNVLETVSDRKLPNGTVNNAVSYFSADVITSSDYYPFGQIEPSRNSTYSTAYRFGYNSKEQDPELKGGDNSYNYGMRMFDPRLARFMSVDPLARKYSGLTPYQFASNSPICGIDLDGLEYFYNTSGDQLNYNDPNNKNVYITDQLTIDENDPAMTGVNDPDAKAGNPIDYNAVGKNVDWNAVEESPKTTDFTKATGANNDLLLAFAAVIDNESSGRKDESYTIGNVTSNYIADGGSTQLSTLADVVLYKNSFARGATQANYTSFIGETSDIQNKKYAVGAAINALGTTYGVDQYSDYSNGATGWDGRDLIYTTCANDHRDYTWSKNSEALLEQFQKANKGGVDVTKFKYDESGYQIEATKIIGGTLFEKLNTPRGEGKDRNQPEKFN